MRLYELTEAWESVQALIDNDETQEEQLQAALENIEGAIDQKADGYGRMIKNLQAQAEVVKVEEKRLAAKRQTLENQAKRLQKHLESAMIATNKRKINTELFVFSVQKNAPSLADFDESIVPEEYWKVTRSVDRSALLKAVKDGEVEGIGLKQTESLRIR